MCSQAAREPRATTAHRLDERKLHCAKLIWPAAGIPGDAALGGYVLAASRGRAQSAAAAGRVDAYIRVEI